MWVCGWVRAKCIHTLQLSFGNYVWTFFVFAVVLMLPVTMAIA